MDQAEAEDQGVTASFADLCAEHVLCCCVKDRKCDQGLDRLWWQYEDVEGAEH